MTLTEALAIVDRANTETNYEELEMEIVKAHTAIRASDLFRKIVETNLESLDEYDVYSTVECTCAMAIRLGVEAGKLLQSANAGKSQPRNESTAFPLAELGDVISLKSAAQTVLEYISPQTGQSSAPFYSKERAAGYILDLCRKIEQLQSANAGKSQATSEPGEERQNKTE
jgi:hypothetical protein